MSIAPGRRLRIRAALLAQTVALAASGLGAAQALLLLHRAGGSVQADAYFLAYAAGQSGAAVLLSGVVYPHRLARPGAYRWNRTAAAAAAVAAAGAVAAGGYLALLGKASGGVVLMLSLLAGAVGTQGAASAYAVRLACAGRPVALSAVTIGPNAAAAVVLLLPVANPVLAMCAVLLVASVMTLAAVASAASAAPVPEGRAERLSLRGGRWAVLATAVTGTAFPLVLLGVLATAPDGAVANFAVVYKVGLALTGVFVNAALPAFVNWAGFPQQALRWAAAGFVAAAGLAAAAAGTVPGTAAWAMLSAWAFMQAASSVASQTALRKESHRGFAVSAATNVVCAAGAVLAVEAFGSRGAAAALLVATGLAFAAVAVSLSWRGEALAAVPVLAAASAADQGMPGASAGLAVLAAAVLWRTTTVSARR